MSKPLHSRWYSGFSRARHSFNSWLSNLNSIWLPEMSPRSQPQYHIHLHPLGTHKGSHASSWGFQSRWRHTTEQSLRGLRALTLPKEEAFPSNLSFACVVLLPVVLPPAYCTCCRDVFHKGASRNTESSTACLSWRTKGAQQGSQALPSLPYSEQFAQ